MQIKFLLTKNNQKVMKKDKLFYYRIYDDKEDFNFIKSSLDHKTMEGLLKNFEKTHKKYLNKTFVKYLQKSDPDAEIIEVSEISY
jgi:hypothetical protein